MAERIDQYQLLDTTAAGFGEYANIRYRGQGFVPGITTLTAIAFRLGSIGSTGIKVYIDTADEDSTPVHTPESAVYSFTIPNASLSTSLTRYALPTTLTLARGQRYVIYLAPWDIGNDRYSDDYRDLRWTAANAYGSGQAVVNNGGSWSVSDGGELDLVFRTYGDEPVEIPLKRFYYKIYSAAGVYITTWVTDVISLPEFNSFINGGAGQLKVVLARSYDNFGEGQDVSLQNRVECWVADADNTASNTAAGAIWDVSLWDSDSWDTPVSSFKRIFAGFISEYAPVLDDDEQYIEITVLGYIAEASVRVLKDSSGNTTVSYASEDPGAILEDVIDKYRADGGSNINYTGGSIARTGTVVSYTFNHNTLKEVFDKIVELCPNGYYWYLDPTGTIHLQSSATSRADHTLTIGKDVGYFKASKRIENLANVVYVLGGGNPNLFNRYERSSSASTYGKFERKIQDGRVTLDSTSDVMAQRQLDRFDSPETRLMIRITDNNGETSGFGADIEDFVVGETVQVKNLRYGLTGQTYWDQAIWDTDVWDATLLYSAADILVIQSIIYHPEFLEIEASSRVPFVAKRIEDISRNLDTEIQSNLPSAPVTRSV